MRSGYDYTINTTILFRKVDGVIRNNNHPNGQEKLIIGIGTKFFKDVRKGDLVRLHGVFKNPKDSGNEKVSGTPMSVYNIVKEVISDTILSFVDYVGLITPLHLDDGYMEVIDYKTKEGIHYSNIPFVSSEFDLSISIPVGENPLCDLE